MAQALEAVRMLMINANRLCDRQLGGTYEADCRRTLADMDRAYAQLRLEHDALQRFLEAFVIATDEEGRCVAHGEETDLCDACLYERQKKMVAAADFARDALRQ